MEQTTQPTPSPQPKKRRISKKQRRIMKIKAVLTLLFLLALFIGILLMIYLKNAVPTIIFSGACFVFAFWHFYKFK